MTDDDSTPDQTPAPEPPKTRWRDRAIGFRGVVAVGLATLILGGVGGAAVGVLATNGDDHERRGPAQMDFRDGDRPPHGGPGMPGFGGGVPPGTPPQEDVEPDDSGDSSGDTGSGTDS